MLAERLGKTVGELMSTMSNWEYDLWQVFDVVKNIKQEEAEKRAKRK